MGSPLKPNSKPVVLLASNDLFIVRHEYPAEVSTVPALANMFKKEFEEARASTLAEAKDVKATAGPDGLFTQECSDRRWWTVANTPDWLNLAGEGTWNSTGMAHPNSGPMNLLWERRSGRTRTIQELFTSLSAASAILKPVFCREIDLERIRRRREPVDRSEAFGKCLEPADYSMTPGSSDGRALDFIDITVPPYEAGPYAEGAYRVRLPVTPALVSLVRAKFRSSFAAFEGNRLSRSAPQRADYPCE